MTVISAEDLEGLLPYLAPFARCPLLTAPTPIDHAPRLSDHLGVNLHVKRDDLMSLGFGGNKVRQLEFYFGEALAQDADHVLITGAVQSNFMRLTAAAAAKLGMKAILQLEERVPNKSKTYMKTGNVQLFKMLGAELHHYPSGEDEAGADAAMAAHAEKLRQLGHRPYQIHLAPGHAPVGALGYLRAAAELKLQAPDKLTKTDAVVVGSGSGYTHAGLLTGLRLLGIEVPVFGICVRRDAVQQTARIQKHCQDIADLVKCPNPVKDSDIQVFDHSLAPGYGQLNDEVVDALKQTARLEGLILDPVYTARVMAGLFALAKDGTLQPGQQTLFMHTGGTPALFAYADSLRSKAA